MAEPTINVELAAGGIERVVLSFEEGQRGEVFALLRQAAPALEALDRALSGPAGSEAGASR